MKPRIDRTKFGEITVDGTTYDHDIVIRLDGEVKKRKKKLSKEVYGTSHTISIAEAEHIYQDGAQCVLIGSGQEGMVALSPEAQDFFEQKNCRVELQPTPEAIKTWNHMEGSAVALFHVTC